METIRSIDDNNDIGIPRSGLPIRRKGFNLPHNLLMCFALFIISGCGESSADIASASTHFDNTKYCIQNSIVQAGVLFSNQSSYLCIPLDELGVDSETELPVVSSSCECIRPMIVRYLKPQGIYRHALRLNFVPDMATTDDPMPSSLGVQVLFKFPIGRDRSVTVKFLHTLEDGAT